MLKVSILYQAGIKTMILPSVYKHLRMLKCLSQVPLPKKVVSQCLSTFRMYFPMSLDSTLVYKCVVVHFDTNEFLLNHTLITEVDLCDSAFSHV